MSSKFFFLFFLILLPFASGYTSGDDITFHFDKCAELYVYVTASANIDIGEYNFTQCNETVQNTFYCKCTNDYDLVMSTKINTVNSYTLNISRLYYENLGTSGGGGIRHVYDVYYPTVFIDNHTALVPYVSKPVPISVPPNSSINTTVPAPVPMPVNIVNQTNETKLPTEAYVWPLWVKAIFWGIIIELIIIILLCGYVAVMKIIQYLES